MTEPLSFKNRKCTLVSVTAMVSSVAYRVTNHIGSSVTWTIIGATTLNLNNYRCLSRPCENVSNQLYFLIAISLPGLFQVYSHMYSGPQQSSQDNIFSSPNPSTLLRTHWSAPLCLKSIFRRARLRLVFRI